MRLGISKLVHRPWYNRVQILSDLHLEIGQQYASYTFPVTAPYLLLAGDIGRLVDYDNYLLFLEAQTARCEIVLLVLGNHEFYGLGYADALDAARRLAAEPTLRQRLVLLHCARWDSPRSRLTVLGCTLWSAVPHDRADLVRSKVSDFTRIDGWTTAAHNSAHEQEAAWLRDEVAGLTAADATATATDATRRPPRSVLVATHHAPCVAGASAPEHVDSPWSSAFATDVLAGGRWAPLVKTWVFGHTHYSTDMVREGVRVVANQRGYVFPQAAGAGNSKKREKRMATGGFDPGKVVIG